MTAARIAGLAVALAVSASAALAFGPGQGGRHGERPSFAELDLDKDGQITQAEFEAHRQTRFDAADTDKDGKLSAAEIQAEGARRAEDRAAAMIKEFDKDGDGMLSAEELPKPKRMGKMFDRLDADNSGGISQEEFAEMEKRMEHRKGHETKKN